MAWQFQRMNRDPKPPDELVIERIEQDGAEAIYWARGHVEDREAFCKGVIEEAACSEGDIGEVKQGWWRSVPDGTIGWRHVPCEVGARGAFAVTYASVEGG